MAVRGIIQPTIFLLDGPKFDKLTIPPLSIERKSSGNRIEKKTATIHQEQEQTLLKISIERNFNNEAEDLRKDTITFASQVTTCLRLELEGGIGYNQEIKEHQKPETIEEYGLPNRPPKLVQKIHFDFHGINFPKINQRMYDVGEIIRRDSEDGESLFKMALSWFNRSYDEENLDNILINLIICLETLFILKNENKKKALLKERLSRFLKDETNYIEGNNPYEIPEWNSYSPSLSPNQESAKLIVCHAYNLRSTVIHEGRRYFEVHRYPDLGTTNKKALNEV